MESPKQDAKMRTLVAEAVPSLPFQGRVQPLGPQEHSLHMKPSRALLFSALRRSADPRP